MPDMTKKPRHEEAELEGGAKEKKETLSGEDKAKNLRVDGGWKKGRKETDKNNKERPPRETGTRGRNTNGGGKRTRGSDSEMEEDEPGRRGNKTRK